MPRRGGLTLRCTGNATAAFGFFRVPVSSNVRRHVIRPPSKEVRRSLSWAAVISLPLLFLGYSNSMGLAHAGGPLLLLYVPVFPVMFLFGWAPAWLSLPLAAMAEFAAVFLIVHWFRGRESAKERR